MSAWNKIARAMVVVAGAGLALAFTVGTATANDPPSNPACNVKWFYTINGVVAKLPTAQPGDHIVVNFTVPAGCTDQLTFAAYRSPVHKLDPKTRDQQILDNYQSGTFTGPGRFTLAIDVPGAPAGDPADCAQQHDNSNGGGANGSGAYNSTCNGAASQNGNSTNNNSSKPCAGCVGNADNKNPPGQAPNGNDPNAGYECDSNQGVGQTNPAHSGCQGFQLDFAYGPVIQQLGVTGTWGNGIIGFFNG